MRTRKNKKAAASGSNIKSAKSRLPDYIKFAPDTGHVLMFDQRMLLMHGFSLAELRRELIERLGLDQARRIFTRMGYQQGLHDYQQSRTQFGDDVGMMVLLGPRIRSIEGYVSTEPIELRFNQERSEFFGHYAWADSWEAEAHSKHLGIGNCPACWMSVGYASGFGTGLFGRPVLFRELECVALGHSRCRILGKTLAEWDDPDVPKDVSFFRAEEFVDLPQERRITKISSVQPIHPTSKTADELVGASATFNSVVYLLKRVAETDATVIFLGESGVGKEQFAKTLHKIGPRKDKPFISINCAAIPHDLVESELFGVERGAFTGATQSRAGRFERAEGGTLFLDEIGSLSLPAQGKLLRALQEREIERVGDTQVRKVDVRVVAATNEDLRKAVAEKRFRADLFFRLNVFPIEIPPLRSRREDIPLLLNLFVERYGRRFGKQISGITQSALDALWRYEWPGNVRELENMVERAVILAEENGTIEVHHLFSGGETLDSKTLSVSPMGDLIPLTTPTTTEGLQTPAAMVDNLIESIGKLSDIESLLLERAMSKHDGNISGAARSLGLGRGQMQYRLDKRKRK